MSAAIKFSSSSRRCLEDDVGERGMLFGLMGYAHFNLVFPGSKLLKRLPLTEAAPWRRVVDKIRTLIQEHSTEFDVFAKTVLNFSPAN